MHARLDFTAAARRLARGLQSSGPMAHPAYSVFTLLGWSPRTTGFLRGWTMPCGCVAGEYETRQGVTLTVVDAVASGCTSPAHRANAVLDVRSERAVYRPGVGDGVESIVGAPER